MNKLQLPQAKLFYIVGEAYRKRMIDETERRLLKGTKQSYKRKNNHWQCLNILDSRTKRHIINSDWKTNRACSCTWAEPKSLVGNSKSRYSTANLGVQQPVEQEEASSPWGEFLRRKKYGMKGQQHGQEVQELKSLIKPEKADWFI